MNRPVALGYSKLVYYYPNDFFHKNAIFLLVNINEQFSGDYLIKNSSTKLQCIY